MLNKLEKIFDMSVLIPAQQPDKSANPANVSIGTENLLANDLLMPANVIGWPSRNQNYISNVSNTLANGKGTHTLSVSKISSASNIVSQQLLDFQGKAKNAASLNELTNIVQNFCQHDWAILERASMSDSYTQTAIRLIENEGADKYRTLEDLA